MKTNRSPFFTFLLCCIHSFVLAQQDPYEDSITAFRKHYIQTHEVLAGDDRQNLQFFPIDPAYCVPARFEKLVDAPWFQMVSSGSEKKTYRAFGLLYFSIHDTILRLTVYQSQRLMQIPEYADYLLVPFTDKTNGVSSYENGRYLDASVISFEQGSVLIDFNKAYNPYCAYVTGKYNCPIPPPENNLPLSINAGEKKYRELAEQ